MTERFDHAAKAREVGDLANYAWGEGLTDAAGLLASAQVNAIEALVEQQRIANLVALAEHAQRRYGAHAGEAGGMGTLFSYGDTPDSNIRIRANIREGLGL